MSTIHPQSFDKTQKSELIGNDNFENDDLVTFQHDSKKIKLYYSQLTKYSKHIRDSYLFADVINHFPQEIHKLEEESQVLPESIDIFFQLLQQNYDINDQSNFTYINCVDLLKISKFLEIRKLSFNINEYIKSHNFDVDFIIQMIQYEIKIQKETDDSMIEISEDIEQMLTSKINECLLNEKFKELPIQIIYRVVSKSSPNSINNNKLFDIIMKSIDKYCVLFQFLDLQKLSEDRLDDLCEMYSNSDENSHQYFNYLKCNLNLIREINKRKKSLDEEHKNQLNDLETKISSLQNQFNESEKIKSQLQNQLNDTKELNNEQQSEMKELKTRISSLQNQFNESEKIKSQLQNQLNDTKELNSEQQTKMKELESQVSQLQNKLTNSEKEMNDFKRQLDEIFVIKGKIAAKVENGIFISAEINLIEKSSSLDKSKSKFIISTSGEKCLGIEAYEKGEPITSLNMKTSSYMCRQGTYFVRCLVFNSDGKSNEIVSNSVTTNRSCLTFEYEEKPAKISLPKGRYKLEVWGAKGGNSTGNGEKDCSDWNRCSQSSVQGGFGGYSRGILNLKKNETVFVYVGGEGRASNSPEGSSTEGGFPDGGGTKTGHRGSSTTVPGTGGGSTSIRIGSDTNYARVIVAGGGGGASGDSAYADPGGFGGGLSGGNCSYQSKTQSQGAGTQKGSTNGLGLGCNGDPGQFGLGATCKYRQGSCSGGGGGGGWYGGGSGGYGNNAYCSSGGGGSGWIFTESSHKEWHSRDSANASKFVLDSFYYLTDAICVGGNEEFPKPDENGVERGHADNGYAKITPL